MRLIIWLILGYVIYVVAKGFMKGREKLVEPEVRTRGEETHCDPVCGVYVSEEDAVVGRIDEQRVYFCSMACLEKYKDQLVHKQ
jgi:YHS domain-containing protein